MYNSNQPFWTQNKSKEDKDKTASLQSAISVYYVYHSNILLSYSLFPIDQISSLSKAAH